MHRMIFTMAIRVEGRCIRTWEGMADMNSMTLVLLKYGALFRAFKLWNTF